MKNCPVSALGTLRNLAKEVKNTAPKISIGNGLPNGYILNTYGCAFYYRKNQNLDPEVVTVEDDPIPSGQKRSVRGSRRDCCRQVLVGIDVKRPDGSEVPVYGNLEAPGNKRCIVHESVVVQASLTANGHMIIHLVWAGDIEEPIQEYLEEEPNQPNG